MLKYVSLVAQNTRLETSQGCFGPTLEIVHLMRSVAQFSVVELVMKMQIQAARSVCLSAAISANGKAPRPAQQDRRCKGNLF